MKILMTVWQSIQQWWLGSFFLALVQEQGLTLFWVAGGHSTPGTGAHRLGTYGWNEQGVRALQQAAKAQPTAALRLVFDVPHAQLLWEGEGRLTVERDDPLLITPSSRPPLAEQAPQMRQYLGPCWRRGSGYLQAPLPDIWRQWQEWEATLKVPVLSRDLLLRVLAALAVHWAHREEQELVLFVVVLQGGAIHHLLTLKQEVIFSRYVASHGGEAVDCLGEERGEEGVLETLPPTLRYLQRHMGMEAVKIILLGPSESVYHTCIQVGERSHELTVYDWTAAGRWLGLIPSSTGMAIPTFGDFIAAWVAYQGVNGQVTVTPHRRWTFGLHGAYHRWRWLWPQVRRQSIRGLLILMGGALIFHGVGGLQEQQYLCQMEECLKNLPSVEGAPAAADVAKMRPLIGTYQHLTSSAPWAYLPGVRLIPFQHIGTLKGWHWHRQAPATVKVCVQEKPKEGLTLAAIEHWLRKIVASFPEIQVRKTSQGTPADPSKKGKSSLPPERWFLINQLPTPRSPEPAAHGHDEMPPPKEG